MNKFCLVFTLSAPWEGYHRKPFIQHIAEAVRPLNGTVLCIEPTLTSMHTLLKYPERIKKWLRGFYNLRRESENICVFSPKTVEHLLFSVRFIPLQWLNSFLIQKQLNSILKLFNLKINDAILVVHRPELYFLKKYIDFRGMIYDCWDNFCSTSNMKNFKVLGNVKREVILAHMSDFIIATSELLFTRNVSYNSNTYLVENGFSHKLFQESDVTPNLSDVVLNIKKKLKRPVVGYIGNIKHWIDFNLIEYLVTSKKNWTFLFVGPLWEEYGRFYRDFLYNNNNVIVTGFIDYSVFPSFLKLFDVAIIPFQQNEFMRAVNPNKFYEYIGAGLPIVSTDIGDLRTKYSDVVRIAVSKTEFLHHLDELIKMDDEEKRKLKEKILTCSQKHTWELKSGFFVQLLKKYFDC